MIDERMLMQLGRNVFRAQLIRYATMRPFGPDILPEKGYLDDAEWSELIRLARLGLSAEVLGRRRKLKNLKSLCEKVLEDSDEADSIYDKRVIRLVKAVIVLSEAHKKISVCSRFPGESTQSLASISDQTLTKANEIARGEE